VEGSGGHALLDERFDLRFVHFDAHRGFSSPRVLGGCYFGEVTAFATTGTGGLMELTHPHFFPL